MAALIDQLPIRERLVRLRNISDLLIIDVVSSLSIRPPDIVVDVVQVGVRHESSHISSFLHAQQLRSILATTCSRLDHQGLQGWIIAPLWHIGVSDEVEALHLERPLQLSRVVGTEQDLVARHLVHVAALCKEICSLLQVKERHLVVEALSIE